MSLLKQKDESLIKNNKMIDENGREIAISVENLVMEFKVSKDRIDTLKEYVIRTIKRNKTASKTVRILDDLTFKVYKGERVGVLGFNGAGKSTLLKIISGIYEPTDGDVKINGKIAPLLALSAGFDKNYTGRNNIYLNGAFLSMTEDYINEHFDEIVEFSELGEFINYPVKNYSSGMKSKLGFSIATLIKPDILIIDEILSVGDIKFRKKSSEKIQSMMQEGVTVLLVSHSIAQIRKICDRCIWIENGKLVMEGPTEEVCDAYVENAESGKKKKKGKKK
ncbi:MAG: ABC transporter ATP-binding protein [Methanobrevibacter sp.]|nr:ABC transporter ATP-binding protein [Methanobrevibacter sp.]